MTSKPFFYLKLFVDAKSSGLSGGSQTHIPSHPFCWVFCDQIAAESVVHMV
jgi:hypothetical protein